MIKLSFGTETIEVQESDSSYRYRAIMQKPQLILKFSLPYWVDIPIGATCTYMNERYRLNAAPNIKKNGTRNIEYSLTMGTDEEDMSLYKLRNSVDKRLKWSMCAKPHEFIEEIVKNLNERSGFEEWKVGECIEANEQTIEFNHSYIDAALSSVAETFKTEWEIVGKTIHLHKVEYFKEDPLPLSYGKGNGFVPGLGRTTPNDEKPIKRLYVQGGEKNIDRSQYGTAELLLPKSQKLEYEGRTYQSDEQGYYIERVDKISDAVREDSLDCSEIYPSRIGKVSKVIAVKPEKNFYDFIDSSIPDNLDFNKYLIKGETPYIRFQSGMLAGEKDFEFTYKHSERRFELVPQEIDGVTMPNETFIPAVGNTYAIFGIMLPDEYICNDEDKSGASWDMFREAAKHLYENEEQKFTFSGTLQGLWTKRNWGRVGGRLKVGSYILFSDEQFAQEGVAIRITGIKDFLTSPYTPTIEISSSVSGGSVSSQLREIEAQEIVIAETKNEIMRFTKRRFRDAKETLSMLEDSLLNFSNSINPISVQTMAMLVGDESLQFRFVDSRENLSPIEYAVSYDTTTKQLHCPAGFIQHMTLGISTISSAHSQDEYKVWEMGEYLSPVLDDSSKKYYLYAKVRRDDTEALGQFELSESAIDMDYESGYYYLLVGVLNSEYEEERSFVSLYGFTEVLPGRITTDKIVSSDGNSWINLQSGEMQLGDKLQYLAGKLYLDFLFSEGANIGGWIFKNGKLVSQNGSTYMDGEIGEVRLKGTLQLSTAYEGTFTDANIFYLPPITETKTLSIGADEKHIGKVIRLFNSSPFGGANYRIKMRSFEIDKNKESSSDTILYSDDDGDIVVSVSVIDESEGVSYNAILRPQETLEITCLEVSNTDDKIKAQWEITSRFSQEMFINDTDIGRFPRLIAMGRMNFNNNSPYISGSWWNSSAISSKMSVKRQDTGNYRISFAQSDIPSGYKVIVSGYGAIYKGTNSIKAGVYETSDTYFDVHTSDDSTRNDGSFDFIIFAPNWEYNLK